jgi:hypothetical protein
MTPVLTANEVKGRAIGSLFTSGFGALWLLLALYVLERLNIGTALGVLLVATALYRQHSTL